jgi:eukaryotic-like serine/threonine-protein kinase
VHAARVLHRDVKPANILVDQEGGIFLVDFGIAKIHEDAAAGRQRDMSITGRGRVIGTPEYLAPEQIYGHPATPASDLWSLGVTLYYAIEGHTPFARASGQPAMDLRSAILYEDPPPPASRGSLTALIRRLLAKDPDRRPDLSEVYRVLESIMTDRSQNRRPSATAAFPEPGPIMVRTDAMAFTEAMRPLDYAERARHGIADAVRDVNPSGGDSGVARLLAKPDNEAAHILNNCSPEVAAELVTGMAASRVSKAGNILQMLSVSRSGKVIDHMPPAASAAVIVALPERRQQVRVLSQADVRTVAEVLMELTEAPGEFAERLVASMSLRRAGAVLNEVKPLTAARILRGQSANLRAQLLQALSPEFRDIVLRFL